MEQITKDKIANAAVLEKCSNVAIRRRLTKELEPLYSVFWKIDVHLDELLKPKVTIYENMGDKSTEYPFVPSANVHKYDFIINSNYPFVQPEVFFQNRKYCDFLRVVHSYCGYKIFKQVTGMDCLCCHSITCNSNWSPSITLPKIIEEIHHYKQLKRNIVNKVFANVIKKKYLIDDIDLDSWLF